MIQIFNVGAERMLGYTAAEVMNKFTRVRSIVVEKHGGSIGVVSSPNVGTCFTLRLPIGGPAMDVS